MVNAPRLALAAVLLAAPVAHAAEPEAAQRLGRAIASCELASTADYRDAQASDYPGPIWQQWMAQTGSQTPWRAEGDFDGDGVADVAKVLVDRTRPRWMMGVEFGPKGSCRRFQLSAQSLDWIAAVLVMPKGKSSTLCHYANGEAVTCKAPDDAAFAARPGDAVLTFDMQQSYMKGYYWRSMRATADGWIPAAPGSERAKWVFDHVDLLTERVAAAAKAEPATAPRNAQHAAIVAEFNRAWRAVADAPKRRIVLSVQEGDSAPAKVTSVFEYVGKTRSRTIFTGGDERREFITVDGKSWLRNGDGPWQSTASWPDPPEPDVLAEGDTIAGMREETRNGHKVKVIDVVDTSATPVNRRRLTLDVARGLPLQLVSRHDGVDDIATRDFDYDTAVDIAPP